MGAGSIHFRADLAADFLAFFDLWKKQGLQKPYHPRLNRKSRALDFRINGSEAGKNSGPGFVSARVCIFLTPLLLVTFCKPFPAGPAKWMFS